MGHPTLLTWQVKHFRAHRIVERIASQDTATVVLQFMYVKFMYVCNVLQVCILQIYST